MDLRTRYTALVTLMTQYIKFAGDSLKRLEEEEVTTNYEQPTKKQLRYVWENKKSFHDKFTWLINYLIRWLQ